MQKSKSFLRFFVISSRSFIVVTFVLSVLVALAAIDGRSFWIDEAGTWAVTRAPDLNHWWSDLLNNKMADGQQPVYHFFMYNWVRIFGDSERAMRLSNLPWFVLGCLGMVISKLPPRLRLMWVLIVIFLAPIWYYLNEARPYMMFFAGGAWLSAGWIGLVRAGISRLPLSSTDIALYAIGSLLILSATSLGVIWIASSALGMILVLHDRRKDAWDAVLANRGLLLICFACAAAILAVVGRNFLHGGRASKVGGFSIESVAYGLVEVAGFAGLGPGRNELRVGLGHISPVALAVMGIFGSVAFFLALSALRRLDVRTAAATSVACILPLVLIVLVSFMLDWRAVGRHFLLLILPVSLAYAAEIEQSISLGNLRRFVVFCVLGALLISTARIRFSHEYYKDDYADTANYVRPFLAHSKIVLWAADPASAAYYHLVSLDEAKRLYSESLKGMTFRLPSQAPPHLKLPAPDFIVYSKPDIYDPSGAIRSYISSHGLECVSRFPSFEVFALPSTTSTHQSYPGSEF